MTSEDYKEIERLLSKLQLEVKHRIVICPHYIQDLAYVGLYGIDGHIIKSSHGLDIEDCIDRINKQPHNAKQ